MPGDFFNGRGKRTLLGLAILAGALCLSGATVFAQSQVPSDSRLKSIIAKKVMRIGYRADARPFSFLNDAKEPLGYTIDLCKQVTDSIGAPVRLAGAEDRMGAGYRRHSVFRDCRRQGRHGVRLLDGDARPHEGGRLLHVRLCGIDRRSGDAGVEYPLIRRNGREERSPLSPAPPTPAPLPIKFASGSST